jgi:hypothetical protein
MGSALTDGGEMHLPVALYSQKYFFVYFSHSFLLEVE